MEEADERIDGFIVLEVGKGEFQEIALFPATRSLRYVHSNVQVRILAFFDERIDRAIQFQGYLVKGRGLREGALHTLAGQNLGKYLVFGIQGALKGFL